MISNAMLSFWLLLSLTSIHTSGAFPIISSQAQWSRIHESTSTIRLDYKSPSDSSTDNNDTTNDASTESKKRKKSFVIPNPPLKAPFPNGLCKGTIINLPKSLHYDLDTNPTSTLFLQPRDIQVWLPPQYDTYPELDFPVLYCHDGQNMMFDSSSWTGSSWRLAGALTRLSERGLLKTPMGVPPIVVLLPR